MSIAAAQGAKPAGRTEHQRVLAEWQVSKEQVAVRGYRKCALVLIGLADNGSGCGCRNPLRIDDRDPAILRESSAHQRVQRPPEEVAETTMQR